ncbi:hypothetical protein N1027_18010 [Herbiconiux sp. CPCC 205763]|uniref:Toxin-antitoxin system HicB family antitoxin n=1 Tax=Herbiconiux aconitum TaxID=2970913 RepID=A0ABT2GXJ5_9MICO|nr:hypothetical protein [Herbiconiux aconitum]MCS5720030.1 hypothetical protein [Herbiconiux aconitum]
MTPTIRTIHVEVSAELWMAAQAKAMQYGDELNAVVAEELANYVQAKS